jgi:hypothetical protein
MSENTDNDEDINLEKMLKMETLIKMKFSFVKSEEALRNSNWNLERAIEKLINVKPISIIDDNDYINDYNNSEYDSSETVDENNQIIDNDTNNIANNYIMNGNNMYNINNCTSNNNNNKNNHLDQEKSDKLDVLIDQMGFDIDKAEESLVQSDWNVEGALEKLVVIENPIINTNDIDNAIASAPPVLSSSSSFLGSSLLPPQPSNILDNLSRQLSADSNSKMQLYFAIHTDFIDVNKQKEEVFEILKNISLGFKSEERMNFKETLVIGGNLNVVKNMMNYTMKERGVTKTNIGFNFDNKSTNNTNITNNNMYNNVEINNFSPRSNIRQERKIQDEEYLKSLKIDKENQLRKEKEKNELKINLEQDSLYNYTSIMFLFYSNYYYFINY